jgi:Fungalysin metallopeptidase (M36)
LAAGQQVPRASGSFVYPFTDFTPTNAVGGCSASARCSWNHTEPSSPATNRKQNAVQAFYLANVFHDHLAAAPIGFTDRSFEGLDPLVLRASDGGGVNNANMATPPDGQSPTMRMYLWSADGDGLQRDVNGGDDAAILWHEYTHGLSDRLVTTADGSQALNEPQAGSMAEGWSDFYAKDFIVGQGLQTDTGTPGEIDMAVYVDAVPHVTRYEALDCPARADAGACPGSTALQGGGEAGSGGFTYGDYGRIFRDGATLEEEPHADGEIWVQTLWDLRAALHDSAVTLRLVTEGLRMTPEEPTFLQARDAILQADTAVFGGIHTGAIWQVFAQRGMGRDAIASPVAESFDAPGARSLAVSSHNPTVGAPVTLDARAVRGTGAVLAGYDWDVDGNGTVDRFTSGPTTTVAYGSTGTFTPRVWLRFADAGSSTAVADSVTVTPTPTVTPPPPSSAPVLVLPRRGTRARVRFTVRCDSVCSGTARLSVSKALARKLGMGRKRTLVKRAVRLSKPGTKRYTLKLSRKATRAMRRRGMRTLKTSLKVSVRDAELQRASASRAPRIRR